MYSMVLYIQLARAIGRYLEGLAGSFPGFGTGMMIAFLQPEGKRPVDQILDFI